MSGSDLPSKAQLLHSCNAVENVYEVLKNHQKITLINRSGIVPLVKALYTSLQRLEGDEADPDGAFHNASTRVRRNLACILRACDVVTNRVHKRIDSDTLRRDDDLGVELEALNAEIEEFLKFRIRKATVTAQGKKVSASNSSEIVEDLLRKQKDHDSEVEALETELRTLYDRKITLEQEIVARDHEISELKHHDDAKLSHIRRLHAAIANLGLRHPMTHTINDWDELSHELPAMVHRIDKINITLKELELERDERKNQEPDSEEDSITGQMPTVPKAPPAVATHKSATKEKDKEKGDGKKKKEQRKSADAKATSKVRSPSPTSSETSKANTSKSVRRKSRALNTGSSFFSRN